jgi:hypothetical protein
MAHHWLARLSLRYPKPNSMSCIAAYLVSIRPFHRIVVFQTLQPKASLRLTYLSLILFLFSVNLLQAQDSLATVIFYRQNKMAGGLVSYKINHGDILIGKITPGSVIKFQSPPGLQTFTAKTEGESSIKIDIQPGQMYFVECGISAGAFVGHPSFRQVFAAEAKREIAKIDSRVLREIPNEVFTQGVADDSVRAFNNLFQRKRKNGVARAAIFGAVAVVSLIGIITYEPETVTINQGSAGSQVVELDSGPPPASFVLLGVSGVMMVTGITQHNKYSSAKLDILLNDRKQGKAIPEKIKSKLKQKDFK